ncbi:MAG: glycosyltransferase family 4 protein [Flavobacteriales bacterium]|nr:glycosyltransferase family 4 protein [Flavobacteriales bacterium]
MRILQVCLKPPYPKVDGGCMAMAAMTESMLMAGHSVKVICMSTHKHPFDASKVPSEILAKTKMEAIPMDTRLKPLKAFLNIFNSKSYNVERFFSETFEAKLTGILKETEFDVIHLESIFCTPYVETIRKHSKAKVVVRAHNIEFRIWEQLAKNEVIGIKKRYLNLLATRLKNYEIAVLKLVDGIISITEEDKQAFEEIGVSCPIEVIPIGFNVDAIRPDTLSKHPLSLYHVGAMDWQPNIEGINWFLDDVWPVIEAEFPDIECHLAGRKMPQHLLKLSKGKLKIDGQIDSVQEFVKRKNIAIVPLLSGSGMRIKIVEALAMGKVILSTSAGAEGIPYTDGENLLIANTPEEFVLKLRFLSENPNQIVQIGKNARKLASSVFDQKKLSSKLTYFYANL